MTSTTTYEQEIADWRAQMEESLRAEDSWLTVVGLSWLRQGENRVGSGEQCDVLLPAAAPRELGTIVLAGESAVLRVAPGAEVLVGGKAVESAPLRSDAGGQPDVVTAGDISFFLIKRADRLGVRVRDRESRERREFGGREWFPTRPEYRVEAEFAAYDPPRPTPITNILGDVEPMDAAGVAAFALGGQELRLEAMAAKGGKLWFIFRDGTSGHETYPAARFLYADAPQGGRVTLDFNRAYSPPCAFTAYATCPLPPAMNRLEARIEAGELYRGGH